MDTHEQFKDSERRTFTLRLALIAGSLAIASVLPGAEYPAAAVLVLVAIYAIYIAAVKLVLLDRFRSDAWIYGMLAADTILAGAALIVFGPLSPALALPAFNVAYYALFLGRPGASTAAAAGLAAVLAGAVVTPETGVVVPMITSIATFAGVAAVAGLLATDRFNERARREEIESRNVFEARSSRVLSGILHMSNAGSDAELSDAIADAARSATGYPAAVTLLSRSGDGSLVPAAWKLDQGETLSRRTASESLDGETAAASAARQGAAVAVGPGGMDALSLPEWARAYGYRAAIVAPITRGLEMMGAVYVLSKDARPVDLADLEQMELVVSFAARLLTSHSAGAPLHSAARGLDDILSRAGRGGEARAKPPIQIPGISLDPHNERSEIASVGVSLSRTEFSLLYVLAASAGTVVDPQTLLKACWEGDSAPNQNAVDVTIYRLRRKLARVPEGKDIIKTVRGKGYMLTSPVPEATSPAGRP
ncbi:MAG: winged helix-turn-helix domain-containing protein [Dehalococcoidia bacterium]